jgi:Ni,Fe-hydrogenase III large subunit
MPPSLSLKNADFRPIQSIPVLEYSAFAAFLQEKLDAGARLCALFGAPEDHGPRLYAVLAEDQNSSLSIAAMDAASRYPSLTPAFPAAHLFEREIHEQFGILPEGHPWLKPVRFDRPGGPKIGDMPFFTTDNPDVHEVAVGPIHAGVIESGHFRFQCLGEIVLHLEISLGYQHRGVEAALTGGPDKRSLPLMETLAGDSSIAHAWAFASLTEALASLPPAPRGQALRAVALELERLANHTGDLGALAGDIGYLPTASFCGRLRGDFLTMSAQLCGNRFGRGLIAPGGVLVDVDADLCRQLRKHLKATVRDVRGAASLLWESSSVTSRMMGIGPVSRQAAQDLGLVGLAARASGLPRDVRETHPLPHLHARGIHARVMDSGDVYARTRLRQKEILDSASFVANMLKDLPEGDIRSLPEAAGTPPAPLAPDACAVALVEGWRGEVCHVALTDAAGRFRRYKVVDPSFHNWIALGLALRGGQISDFPLCNKSFNLSYCGHDL